ncbi:MAG TPA: class I SAM-dependent methyltransferase [Vicinamibacteria bacterium]|nr:class I SAM-dependent methyltransferase [Vicinamibacteria bacterium]
MERLDVLYRQRFSETARRTRDRVWRVLCRDFFQRYVRKNDTVLDLAAGFGEFIRNIEAGHKIAVDLNPDCVAFLPPDVEFHHRDARDLRVFGSSTIDVCFVSNFFEHLASKDDLDALLAEIRRVLRKGGLLVALQPNIRYAPGEYWDFYDHHIPLSHLSCAEAFRKADFEIVELIDRFLPFTSLTRLPQHPVLVRLYLRFPPAWRVLGRQFLIVGRKSEDG